MTSQPDRIDSLHAQIAGFIERVGWGVIAVGPDKERGIPTFAYSVGAWLSLLHPEILVVGLPPKTAHVLINTAQNKAKEKLLPLDEPVEEIAQMPVVFRMLSAAVGEKYMPIASAWNVGVPPLAMQMYWPDREGRFPWESGFDQHYAQELPV